jgi:hypothetical protein
MKNQVFTLNRLNSLLLVLFWVFMLSRAMAAESAVAPKRRFRCFSFSSKN